MYYLGLSTFLASMVNLLQIRERTKVVGLLSKFELQQPIPSLTFGR